MPNLFLAAAIAALGFVAPLEPGSQLAWHGQVARVAREGAPQAEKTFDVTLLLARQDEQVSHWLWLVDETGHGGWGWAERFGAWESPGNQGDAATGPALLFERDDGAQVIPLPAPRLIAPEPYAPGLTWTDGELTHVVEQVERVGPREAWRVAIANRFGRSRVAWVDVATSLVLRYEQRVFMGQGEEYQLRWELAGEHRLSTGDLATAAADYRELLALREALGRPRRASATQLNPQQLETLTAKLPAVEAAVRTPALASVVRAARRDLETQAGQAGDVASLVMKFEGQPAPKFHVEGLAPQGLTDRDLAGQVTVLHFWDYRDEPLHEPYGQIGYLDFLYQRRQTEGLRVYGVAVDRRLADAETRAAAIRGVRKLRLFMNLGYPQLLDAGELLKQFGDPRLIGAKLPLFVVVGRDGKIAHYHVGHYDVDLQVGLKQLDGVVTEALARPVASE